MRAGTCVFTNTSRRKHVNREFSVHSEVYGPELDDFKYFNVAVICFVDSELELAITVLQPDALD